MALERNLSPELVDALKKEYAKQDGWWRILADDKDTLIAIRNNYLNVYRNGCSIAKVEYSNGKLAVGVHYKFLLKKTIDHPYIQCDDGHPFIKARRSI